MRRIPIFVTCFAMVVLGAPRALAVEECTFNDMTGTATIVVAGGGATIARSGTSIVVDGQGCGTASVTTTDLIEVTPSLDDTLTIDLSGGPLAPGATDEADGSPEIEFSVSATVARLNVIGTTGPDAIGAGAELANMNQVRINLNDDESTWDSDVAMVGGPAVLEVDLGMGDDVYGGFATSGGAIGPMNANADVRTGVGADHVYAHVNGTFETPNLLLDPSVDVLDLSWMPPGCETIVQNDAALSPSSVDCVALGQHGNFEARFFDEIVGTSGDDSIFSGGFGELLRGGPGDDRIIPSVGDEAIAGGPGWDQLIETGPSGVDPAFRFDLSARTVTGRGTDTYEGVEALMSDSDPEDVFFGHPGSQIDLLYGGAGRNVLDLGTARRGVAVHAAFRPDLDAVRGSVWLWVSEIVVLGSPFADRFVGGDGSFKGGDDLFVGRRGPDQLRGGEGADTLRGGAGDDTIVGGPGNDACSGGPGNDSILGCER